MKSDLKHAKTGLEAIYQSYNRRAYVHPDPLEFLYEYRDARDREIVGLVASALAYGRVAQILKSVRTVLNRMTPAPATFLKTASLPGLRNHFAGFKHRFATGEHLALMLMGAKGIIERHGSLRAGFMSGVKKSDESVLPAMTLFCNRLVSAGDPGHLVPLPERGSACKRMNLFLRWMVRKDAVDPGGWDGIPASKLLIPLDVHMHRICTNLGLTKRKQADMRAVIEITAAFARIMPSDPVRYDFALTRFGIRAEMSPEEIPDYLFSSTDRLPD
ncbi:TIGR02757 family protein [Desulfonema ishimotonii]|uniref:TIGR02757 family protein n=1 Tax=Desulfonema ishimotonii TaxID=45657 RepID=A0A401FX58_9BACT|nr:TIGR02757 family protein [Desulfonema ishimotonii]GBC61536.1 TIGR02757 family protein [Desulfonema ishimotonii]